MKCESALPKPQKQGNNNAITAYKLKEGQTKTKLRFQYSSNYIVLANKNEKKKAKFACFAAMNESRRRMQTTTSCIARPLPILLTPFYLLGRFHSSMRKEQEH